MGLSQVITTEWSNKNELFTHIASDKWTIRDALGYNTYAYAIAKFLTDKQTEAPISVSIQAPWGGGKTSLMRMVRYMLDKDAPESSTQENVKGGSQQKVKLKQLKKRLKSSKKENINHPKTKNPESFRPTLDPRVTIWFNAWKYESTEQVWAGLADSIVKGIADRMTPVEREWFYLRLNLKRRDVDSIRH